MSADNWASCPRCYDRAAAEHAAKIEDLLNLPRDAPDWDARRNAIPDAPKRDDFWTFREDYEIHSASTGTVHVDYSGRCQVCSLSLTFSDQRRFYDRTVEA